TGQYGNSGLSQIPQVYGPRPRVAYDFTCRCMNRNVWYKARRIFDYAMGRTFPFWMLSPAADLEFITLQAGRPGLDVVAIGPILDWQYRPYIGILGRDGTRQVRKVVNVVRSGDIDQ